MHYLKLIISIVLVTTEIQCKNSEEPLIDSALWEISGNGLTKPSYLYGTFHYMPVNWFKFPHSLHTIVKSCDVIVLEASTQTLDSVHQSQKKNAIYLPKGKTYASYLPPAAYADMRTFLYDNLNVNDSLFNLINRLKPMYAETKIIRLYYGPLKSYDYYIMNLAEGYEKEVIGLDYKCEIESYSKRYFEAATIEKFWNANDSSGFKKLRTYKKLAQVYLTHPGKELDSIMNSTSDMPAADNEINMERNKKWLPKIEETIHKQSAFIAVGARHLFIKEGLIEMLQAKGYNLKPVKI